MNTLRWISGNDGSLPKDAVCGGTNFDGEPLYVARINLPSGPTPGKMAPSYRIAHAGYGGEEHYSSNYEVLTNPKRNELKWVGFVKGSHPPSFRSLTLFCMLSGAQLEACSIASVVARVADYMLHFTDAVTVGDISIDDIMEQKELVPVEQGKDEGDDHTLVQTTTQDIEEYIYLSLQLPSPNLGYLQ